MLTVGGAEGTSDHCRRVGEVGLWGCGLGSVAERRREESEGRAAVAAGNDGQQPLDCPSIGNGVGEQWDVLPDGGRQAMVTVNYPD